MSTFSPVGSQSSNGMRMCVCVCMDKMNLKYALRWHIHISVHSVLCQCYTHKRTHTRIFKPFEDSEPTGLKVDTADQLHSQFFCASVTFIIKSYTHSSSKSNHRLRQAIATQHRAIILNYYQLLSHSLLWFIII